MTEKETVEFTSYPDGYKKAAQSLTFIPEGEREAMLDTIVTMILKQ